MVDHLERQTSVGAEAANAWPVKASYLRALTDLGMSDAQIARYFKVSAAKVSTLRSSLQDRS
ncbi:hypothetical protein AB7M35_003658 [Amorphus suaedae]